VRVRGVYAREPRLAARDAPLGQTHRRAGGREARGVGRCDHRAAGDPPHHAVLQGPATWMAAVRDGRGHTVLLQCTQEGDNMAQTDWRRPAAATAPNRGQGGGGGDGGGGGRCSDGGDHPDAQCRSQRLHLKLSHGLGRARAAAFTLCVPLSRLASVLVLVMG